MVALPSSDMRLTVALAGNLPFVNHAGTGGVAGVADRNRSIKVAVTGETHIGVIEVFLRIFVEALHAKLAMNTLSIVLAFIAYTPRCVSACLKILNLHED